MRKLPTRICIGGRKFRIRYFESIPGHPDAGSWIDVDSDEIYIRNTCALSLQKRHIILRLVGGITRLLSPDARLACHEFPFGHALFGALVMNPQISSPESVGSLERVAIPGHEIRVVTGTLEGGNEGELDMNSMEIRVAPQIQGYNRFETVWHEIVHILAILIDVGLKEWQVSFLSFCLASMLAQNDFSWLYDDAE